MSPSGGANRGQRKAVCRNGHAYTPENTSMIPREGAAPYQRCKTCEKAQRVRGRQWLRDYQLERRYGLTRAERSDILVSQDGLCAICYERPALTVDHDHATGRVRGMLCKGCNTAIGVIGDTPEAMRNVIDYLTYEAVAS